jgi:hypothetical protein
MRGDEFETDNDQFKRDIAEQRVPCEFCLRAGDGFLDGEFSGRIPARWFVWAPAAYRFC